MTRALVVVDVQNDFCEGGSLAVPGGAGVAARITEHLSRWRAADESVPSYVAALATRDHHIDPGDHFSADPDFVDSWPPHCVVGTDGEAFHPALETSGFEAVFLKGEHRAAYSGFEGTDTEGRSLGDWLRARGVEGLDVCGIATDYCVRATALDALGAGFTVELILDLCAGVAEDTTTEALAEIIAAGGTVR